MNKRTNFETKNTPLLGQADWPISLMLYRHPYPMTYASTPVPPPQLPNVNNNAMLLS
jgi:hypothetical protein